MKASQVFEQMTALAKQDDEVRKKLLNIFGGSEPVADFCAYASSLGYEITPGDIFTEGEEYSCNQLKSTNGGGVIPYDWFDDPFEMFVTAISVLPAPQTPKAEHTL